MFSYLLHHQLSNALTVLLVVKPNTVDTHCEKTTNCFYLFLSQLTLQCFVKLQNAITVKLDQSLKQYIRMIWANIYSYMEKLQFDKNR